MTSSDTLERGASDLHHEPGAEPARKSWWAVARRAWSDAQEDHLSLVAAGVAFYSFMALFPALIAALLLYGLVRDPADVKAQAADWTKDLPSDAASLITKQLEQLSASSSSSLGVGLVIALVLALWSAAGGVGNLVTAVNIAYDVEDDRGFVKSKLLSLALTFGAIVFAVLALALVAAAPAVLDDVVDSGAVRAGLEIARWFLLMVAMTVALGVLYRVAPDREAAGRRWVSVGAVAATVAWLVASLGFSLYVDNFGSYAKTYGALAGVVVLLLWLWLSIYLVLLGASLNRAAERRTETSMATA